MRANVGIIRTTSKPMILVELMNLAFERELCAERDSNVKFVPLARFPAKWIPVGREKMRQIHRIHESDSGGGNGVHGKWKTPRGETR